MSVRDHYLVWCKHCQRQTRVADLRFAAECPLCGNVIPAESLEAASKREANFSALAAAIAAEIDARIVAELEAAQDDKAEPPVEPLDLVLGDE